MKDMGNDKNRAIVLYCTVLLCGCVNIPEAVIMPVDTTWQVANIQGYEAALQSLNIHITLLPSGQPLILASPSPLMDLPDPNKPALVVYIPKGQNLENWTEMLTIQYLGPIKLSPRKVMEQLQLEIRQKCSTQSWHIINEYPNSILYEWGIAQCPPYPDQHEIARLMNGVDGMHRIAYASKINKLPSEQRNIWVKTFSEAYIDKNDKRLDP